MSTRLAAEQDELLQEELNKLRRWAEDEAAALSLRREAGVREVKRLEDEAESASSFNERFQLKQELAMLTKQRRDEDERMFYQGAEIQQKRDELMRQAREKASARVWDELLFVAKWQIVE